MAIAAGLPFCWQAQCGCARGASPRPLQRLGHPSQPPWVSAAGGSYLHPLGITLGCWALPLLEMLGHEGRQSSRAHAGCPELRDMGAAGLSTSSPIASSRELQGSCEGSLSSPTPPGSTQATAGGPHLSPFPETRLPAVQYFLTQALQGGPRSPPSRMGQRIGLGVTPGGSPQSSLLWPPPIIPAEDPFLLTIATAVSPARIWPYRRIPSALKLLSVLTA